jgi:signal transduction histidine kinase/DNA-binding NarL/FixJ family response regulator
MIEKSDSNRSVSREQFRTISHGVYALFLATVLIIKIQDISAGIFSLLFFMVWISFLITYSRFIPQLKETPREYISTLIDILNMVLFSFLMSSGAHVVQQGIIIIYMFSSLTLRLPTTNKRLLPYQTASILLFLLYFISRSWSGEIDLNAQAAINMGVFGFLIFFILFVIGIWIEDYRKEQYIQNQMAAHEQKFFGLTEKLPTVFFQLLLSENNSVPRVEYISPRALELLGMDKKAVYRSLRSIIIRLDPDRTVIPDFDISQAGIKNLSLEVPYDHPRLGRRWFWVLTTPESEKNGTQLLNGILLDITDSRQTMRELEKAKMDAETANEAKTEFLANMSHELRTPLNGIIGMTDLLAGSKLDAEQKEFTQIIRDSGETLLAIINDILDFSKLEAGKLSIIYQPINIFNIIDRIIDLLNPGIQDKGLRLLYTIDPRIPNKVIADDRRIRQILINLLGNAVKFTHDGYIRFSAELVNLNQGVANIALTIEDTGIGIEPNKLDKIFEKFTQADASLSRKYGGTGLGLTICKILSNMMGGDIKAQSKPGTGSKFICTLPLEIPEQKFNIQLNGKTAVILEEDQTSFEYLENTLTYWGATVERVFDSYELASLNHADFIFVHASKDSDVFHIDLSHQSSMSIIYTESRQIPHFEPMRERGWSHIVPGPLHRSRLSSLLGAKGFGNELQGTFMDKHEKLKILLAEDNPVNQNVISRLLQKMNAEVEIAENGQEARESLANQSFDLVFMDCQMPVEDGIEATKLLRKQGFTTPIIALTGHALPGDRERFLEAGMNDYLSKPITGEELKSMLSKWGSGESSESGTTRTIELGKHKPLFDRDTALRMMGDDEEILESVVETFIEDSGGQVDDLQKALDAGNIIPAKKLSHRLKGAASAISAQQLARQAELLEIMLEREDLGSARTMMKSLQSDYVKLIEQLKN